VAQGASAGFFGRGAAAPDDAVLRRTWVYRQVLDAIRDGTLAAGTRLPSARRLADAWSVPRGAVDDAYAQLQTEGLIERRVGNGSFVAARPLPGALRAHPAPEPIADAPMRQARAHLQALSVQARIATPADANGLCLQPGRPDTASFPLALWRRELARALAATDHAGLSYGVPAGLAALRAATARHLSLTRSIHCQPEQVLIVGSPRQAIELVARVLLAPGERVCVEDPGPLSVTRRFSLSHLDVVGVPTDDQGLDVARARELAPDAAAVVLQPLHQWPTGARTSQQRRRELLAWSDLGGAWIVELDSLGEIVHEGAAPPALFGSDRMGRVIFIGSFSALTFPGLRIAYLVLPEPLVEVFAAVRGLLGEHTSVAMQATLAAFIDAGHLSGHVRALRRIYRRRRDALVQAVALHLGGRARLGPVDGGTHACLHLDAPADDRPLAARLHLRGLGVQALSGHSWHARGLYGRLLGYGADDEAAIDAAIAEIAAALRAG
jgi:GntR family transcriptional regulator/MocR family aminotransferase